VSHFLANSFFGKLIFGVSFDVVVACVLLSLLVVDVSSSNVWEKSLGASYFLQTQFCHNF